MHFQQPMLGVPLDWSNQLNKDLVMYLAMNEGHGDVVRDLSMNSNHGTLEGFAFPPTVASGWNPGRTGVGLNFDGTNDYIDCGNGASLHSGGSFAISAWVKTNSISAIVGIARKGEAVAGTYFLWVNADYTLSIYFYDDTSTARNLVSTGKISVGEYSHVVGTYDDGNELRIYINGIEETTSETHTRPGAALTDLFVGSLHDGSNSFNGTIDQVRIYSRALTAKEVLDYYINPWQVYLDEDDN